MHRSPFHWWLMFDYRDWVVLLYLFYLVLLFASDILYGIPQKIMKRFNLSFSGDSSVFVLAFLSQILFTAINLRFDLTGAFDAGIVDYDDVRHTILRGKVNFVYFLIRYGAAPLIAVLCAIVAWKKRIGAIKWFTYGLFFNLLALVKISVREYTPVYGREHSQNGA